MPYIGTDINYGNLAKQTGTGDGADTTPIAALTYTVPSSESILVFLDGVCQVPSTDFTATGTTLTFTTAPANGVAILVMFLGRSLDIGTPADNTVDETKLKDALIGDFSDATVTASDTFLHGDATDSGNTKRDTVQGILDLAGGGDLRNFVIDGDFTQWPEGTSARTIANNTYISALLKGSMSHDGTVTGERSTDVPTVGASNHSSKYSVLLKCTGADASIGASQRASFDCFVTGTDYQHLHAQQVTISFWAKTAAANSGDTYYVSLHNSAFDRSYVQNITVTSTWTKFTITPTLDTTGTWLFTEADKGLVIRFGLSGGTTHDDGTVGSWVAGNERWAAATAISNFMDSTSNEFYLSQLSLVKGSSAPSAFLGESIGTVEDQVSYYVQKFGGDTQYQRFFMGLMTSATNGYFSMRFYKRMRRIPDMSESGTSMEVQSGLGYDASVTLSFGQINKDGCRVATDSMSGMADDSPIEIYSDVAGDYILADARH